MSAFSFCLFYVGERKIEKMKNMEKENLKKKPRKIVFWGVVVKKIGLFCKNVIF